MAFSTFIGFVAAIIFTWEMNTYKSLIFGAIVVVFFFIGWGLAAWINNEAYSQAYSIMEATVKSSIPAQKEVERTPSVVISINIPNVGSRLIRGLKSLDEWQQLANGVINKNYKYTLRDLQDIFGRVDGDRVYSRVTSQLLSGGVLKPAGSNGVEVTDHIGKYFFTMLRDGDFQVLNTLPPYSAPESVRT